MINEKQHFITSCLAPFSWKPLQGFLSGCIASRMHMQDLNHRYRFSLPSYNNTIICCQFLYVAKNMVKKEMARKSENSKHTVTLLYPRYDIGLISAVQKAKSVKILYIVNYVKLLFAYTLV